LEADVTTHKEEVESIRNGTPVLAGEALVNEKLARSIAILKDFRPLRSWVLVRIDTHEKSAGGIYLPENKKERPVQGTVVAIGPEVGDIAVGERVLFGKYAGVEVEMPDGERLTDHRVLRDVECYGKWPAAAK
jgi:chaperonin GroES